MAATASPFPAPASSGSDPTRLGEFFEAAGLPDQPCEGGARLLLASQQQSQLLERDRFAEQPALAKAAVVAAQEVQVAERLHTLGDDVHLEAAPHVDDGAHDGGIALVVVDVTHERLVDLQGADRELLQRR